MRLSGCVIDHDTSKSKMNIKDCILIKTDLRSLWVLWSGPVGRAAIGAMATVARMNAAKSLI